eukprot:CAMPEP_0195281498 /NCGR_PEP_ID=MMETSP0707-20130614/779_1 /TAXON_ID=33640 /ORGANISM="Asterionellopsis glacialis, Strain CCMP134" /LENGTH=663 /DNA_ID=CAMNT_0040340389 /DNA_START=67 /DNA_END=2058 /DNA_ORIENTATION=+
MQRRASFSKSKSRSSIARLRGSLEDRSKSTDAISMFNSTDKKYQKHDEFPPDQLAVWDEFRPDFIINNNMYMYANTHLHEITSMKRALQKVQERGDVPSWACFSIKAWWEGHSEWVRDLFAVNRDFLIPKMEERFHYPEESTEAQKKLLENMATVTAIIDNLIEYGDPSEFYNLLYEWSSYESSVIRYNTLNNNMVTMLYHAYFSPKDITDHNRTILWKASSGYVGSLIHYLGVDAFRHDMLVREKFPPQCWEFSFKAHYEAYVNHTVIHVNALLSGTPSKLSMDSNNENIVERCRRMRNELSWDNYIFFNPYDPMYQIHAEFPPNKLKEWQEDFVDHTKSSSRYLLNMSLRTEVKDMMRALIKMKKRSLTVDAWEVSSLQSWFVAHRKWITESCNLALEIIIPLFETRFHYPTVLKDGFSEQINLLNSTLSDTIMDLKADDTIGHLVEIWTDYEASVTNFFDLYDRMHFLLVHAYFSRDEIAEHFRLHIAPKGLPGLGSCIYHVGKDKFRHEVMKREQLDDFHWRNGLNFESEYMTYVKEAAEHITALESGIPPKGNSGLQKILKITMDNLTAELSIHSSSCDENSNVSLDKLAPEEEEQAMVKSNALFSAKNIIRIASSSSLASLSRRPRQPSIAVSDFFSSFNSLNLDFSDETVAGSIRD